MVRKKSRRSLRRFLRFHGKRASRGQSMVEFTLVSLFLFLTLLGIIEFARFMFVYNVISNAAQEGSRYGIARPRDVISAPQATARVADATIPVPTIQVVGSGNCNIVDKTLDKIWGVPRSDVHVVVWYDDGDGNVIPIGDQFDLANAAARPNRVVVEASYNFNFAVPFISQFSPNGVTVKMRSARTIVNNGDTPPPGCSINMTPAPTYTPVPTNTITPTFTRTATNTPTNTPVPTNTSIPTSTFTPTVTRTPTRTLTPTTSPTSTVTYTPTVTRTPTRTPTGPTSTPTRTFTPTPPGPVPTSTP